MLSSSLSHTVALNFSKWTPSENSPSARARNNAGKLVSMDLPETGKPPSEIELPTASAVNYLLRPAVSPETPGAAEEMRNIMCELMDVRHQELPQEDEINQEIQRIYRAAQAADL